MSEKGLFFKKQMAPQKRELIKYFRTKESCVRK